MHCLIVAGGDGLQLPPLADIGVFDMMICADGGVHNARRLGLHPAIVVGDLDSLDHAERQRLLAEGCHFVVHPPAKDETDLELALLWAMEQGASAITIIGALGDRPDHTFAGLMLLADKRFDGIDITMKALNWQIWLVRSSLRIQGRVGDIVSLIPISGDVRGVETEGLEYPLRREALPRGPARGVSNVMVGDSAQVRLQSGLLLVMHGRI